MTALSLYMKMWGFCGRITLERIASGTIKQADPRTSAWFSPLGDPCLWFAKRDDGTYVFYDFAGYDPQTGVQLTPVTREARRDWEAQRQEQQRQDEHLRNEKLARLQDQEQHRLARDAARKQAATGKGAGTSGGGEERKEREAADQSRPPADMDETDDSESSTGGTMPDAEPTPAPMLGSATTSGLQITVKSFQLLRSQGSSRPRELAMTLQYANVAQGPIALSFTTGDTFSDKSAYLTDDAGNEYFPERCTGLSTVRPGFTVSVRDVTVCPAGESIVIQITFMQQTSQAYSAPGVQFDLTLPHACFAVDQRGELLLQFGCAMTSRRFVASIAGLRPRTPYGWHSPHR